MCCSGLICRRPTWQCVIERHGVSQCVTVCCSMLQCIAVCCSGLICYTLHDSVSQCATVCCSVLQCVAVCCSVLQCVAAASLYMTPTCSGKANTQRGRCNTTHCNTLQHTATHCSTLQHTATHCNTLQHTVAHCNIAPKQRDICALHARVAFAKEPYKNRPLFKRVFAI